MVTVYTIIYNGRRQLSLLLRLFELLRLNLHDEGVHPGWWAREMEHS